MKIILFIFYLFLSNLCISQNYYGINGFGKIEIIDNNKLYFEYYDVGNDSANYKIKKDTIFITSFHQSVEFKYSKKNDYIGDLINVNMKIYKKKGFIYSNGDLLIQNGDLQIDTIVKMDSLNRIYIDSLFLHSGQLISFDFLFGNYKYFVSKDTTYSGFFKLDVIIGKRVYFKNYPLLMRDHYLLPFDEDANENFRKINGFYFLPMKKGKKNQKYKVYLSGFGEIH